MIDVQSYIDKLDRLREYGRAFPAYETENKLKKIVNQKLKQ